MRAKDIMVRDVKRLNPSGNATDALSVLFKMKISGLPVIDEGKRLKGMFTEKEVIAKVLPSYVEKLGNFAYEEDSKALAHKFTAFSKMQVKDVMRLDVVTVSEESPLAEIAHIMYTQKIRRVPVLDKEGKVAGIISRGDVVKALFEGFSK